MINIQPLYDRVIVKPLEAEEKTSGGILLPDTAKEKPQEGRILAVGEGKLMENGTVKALKVKVGDRILYGKYSGTEIRSREGDDVLIIREEDILGIITK